MEGLRVGEGYRYRGHRGRLGLNGLGLRWDRFPR